jgi:hypothetical protein
MLAPLFIFKGKPGGRIEREFTNYDIGGIYYVQDKAWMDQSIMMKWIENVLKPYVCPHISCWDSACFVSTAAT